MNNIHLHDDEVISDEYAIKMVECTICHRIMIKPKATL
jgi:hypothetical protein